MRTKTHKIISMVSEAINRERREHHFTTYQVEHIYQTLYVDVYRKGEWMNLIVLHVNDKFPFKSAMKKMLKKIKFKVEFEEISLNKYELYLN